MNALVSAPEPLAAQRTGTPLLRSLALCDLVDSTGLVERLGDQRGAALLRRHDRLARDLMLQHGGQEIDKTDGFLVLFERPINAVAFALAYQRELKRLALDEAVALQARVGVHVGDVLVWQNDPGDVVHGAKPFEVEGLVKPVTARLASLALPGQILVSGVAASLAQRAHGELGPNADRTRWINHGRYRFKGVPEPVVVYEIGEAGIAPLRQPPYSGKAWREVPWWRRPGTMFIEASIVLGALALGLWLLLRPPAAIAFAERDWVVVGDVRNLTSDASLSETVRVGFRIGMEQSKYINVVSDLRVRDTLKRMQQDPDRTPVDRHRAAEIALREGARAAILPVATEVGGKLRITAEVIDPTSEATVYNESAEGSGVESALDSVDAVNAALRQRLGESLASIEDNSVPLEKVTTSNLDALRAYSLARRAHQLGNFGEALALFHEAADLDPDFALAYVGMAAVYIGGDDKHEARTAIRKAQQLRDKLPGREKLYLDGIASALETPAEMYRRWSLLYKMYPDFHGAYANHALMLWTYDNRVREAIALMKPADTPHNARLGSSLYLLGTLSLANDDYDRAWQYLSRSADMGGNSLGLVNAEWFAVQRRFDEAAAELRKSDKSGLASNDIFRWRTILMLPLDRGDFAEAAKIADEAIAEARRAGPLYLRIFEGMRLGVADVLPAGTVRPEDMQRFVRRELEAAANSDDPDLDHAITAALFGAYLAARNGDARLATQVIDKLGKQADASAFPNNAEMAAIARAELALQHGDAAAAVTLLQPVSGEENLYLAHVVLRDAYAKAGQTEKALEQALFLANHRGQAYEQFGALHLLVPINVKESTVSLLCAAEYSRKLGREQDAARYAAEFRRAWSGALPEAYALRLAEVEAEAKAETPAP